MAKLRVTDKDVGSRADIFISRQSPGISRSFIAKLFDAGHITINDVPVKAAHKLVNGDVIVVDDPHLTMEPPTIDLPVLYEDDNVMVLNKPEGVLTHSKGAVNNEASVASFVKPHLENFTGESNRAGIVHRLDRATSGVIIVAKTAEATKKLQKQFSQRKTKKEYIAIVEGFVEPKAAIIDAPIGRNPAKPQTFKVMAEGKPATTEYLVLRTFTNGGKKYSEVQLKPSTGRTHQLRIHMAYIGHPIVGDHIYGHSGDSMLLHALKLELTLPDSKRQMFTADLPKRFEEFMNE